MASDDRDYFLKRAREEEAAIRAATNPAVRVRHEELASIYRMRFQYVEREARGEPPPAVALPEHEPFVAAPISGPTDVTAPPMTALVA